MTNGNGTKLITTAFWKLLGAICAIVLLLITTNYAWDYMRDCDAGEARATICKKHAHDLEKLGDKIEKVASKAENQVREIQREIKEDFKMMQKYQREDMREIKQLIKDKNGRK